MFYAGYRLFVDRVLNIAELSVLIAEALPGEIPVPFQLLQGAFRAVVMESTPSLQMWASPFVV